MWNCSVQNYDHDREKIGFSVIYVIFLVGDLLFSIYLGLVNT